VAAESASTGSRQTMRVKVLSPARAAFDGEAAGAVLPAFDGEWGILANHAPLVAALAAGRLRITRPDGSGAAFAVRGGFAQVRDNVLTVLTPECAGPGELDAAAVDAELARLHGGEAGKSREECAARARQLAWARACRLVLEGAPSDPKP